MYEYKLVQSYWPDHLSLMVTENFSKGWKLVDNVVVTLVSRNEEHCRLLYTQAMTLKRG